MDNQVNKDNFTKAINFVLQWEGGYSNDTNDPGGETNYGISKRAYPNLDIKNLTREQAIDIYYKDYWLKNNCDMVQYPLCIAYFDTCVNMGSGKANIFILNNPTLSEFTLRRIENYMNIIAKNNSLKIYLVGWIKRTLDLYTKFK